MPRPSSNLPSIFLLTLLFALAATNACRYVGTDRPLEYRNVTSVGVGRDTGEVFGIAIKNGVVYISDGAAGVIKRITADAEPAIFAGGLQTPSAIAFLPSGELIVADTGSHTIRKIGEDGIVTLLAGEDGVRGADDGPALSATFNAPVGLTVDGDGVIYVSDTYNDRIRMIRDGMVTTIAGGRRGFADGVAASASFDTPLGLAIHGDKILVADSGNARVRVIEKNGVVSTLVGGAERDSIDGTLAAARLVTPTAIAVDVSGAVFVADGNSIRVIGRRAIPFVETLVDARFNRPSSLALGDDRELYIADSDNRAIGIVSDGPTRLTEKRKSPAELDPDALPLATRWPFDPPSNPREIAGTLGEIRGEIGPQNKPVWFHNGLDIAGAYGEITRFIRDETVLDPSSVENFGTSRELLRLPLIGYIHLRLGRDKDDAPFADPRFQFERDAAGKLTGVRIARGARFSAGDAVGTLNAMNHVHLIAGRSGQEINALAALELPGVGDSIDPVIEDVRIYDSAWNELAAKGVIRMPERARIVVRAYDRMDGNSERRRLGVYRVGYQLLSNGSPATDVEWRISFERSPTNNAVRLAYADGSRSGYTPDTVFNYIATNRVNGSNASEDLLDTSALPPGRYTVRVLVADYSGNTASRDVEVVK